MDKDSCVERPHNGFPAESLVEGLAGQSLAERFIHCTYVCVSGQVPNLDAVPAVGLKEIGLRQRSGNRIAVVVSPYYKTGRKRQDQLAFTIRIPL
jgi:hypothetical protein